LGIAADGIGGVEAVEAAIAQPIVRIDLIERFLETKTVGSPWGCEGTPRLS
jgi:hypothetical protein